MKKLSILMLSICMMGTLQSNAQFGKLLGKVTGGGKSAGKKSGNFSTVWESEFDNKASRLAVNDGDGSYILGTDDNSATVLDANGKMLWSGDYKKLTTNKTNKSEYQYVIWKEKGGYLFLFDERKMGTDRVAVLDIATGKELWNSEEYQNLMPKGTKSEDGADQGELETVKYISELDAFLISQKASVILVKANTGEKVWETNRFKGGVGKYIYDAKRNEIIMVNFKPTALGALFAGFKNQLVKINAVNGEVLWDATFLGTVEKELVTRRAILDLWIKGDKIYMYLNGLQVYNINNGQKLWEAIYENDMDGGKGLFSNSTNKKYYRTIADPVFEENAVYLVMLGTRDRTKYVEKHDLESGKLLWASEKITGAFSMPNLYKTGDKIMLQIGGKVQVQEYRMETRSSPMGGTYRESVPYIYWDYKAQKNGVLAIDDKTGLTSWRSEKFDKRITDIIIDQDKTAFVGDGDEFYGYDIASGKQLFDVKHNDAGVGKASDVIDFGDKVVVLSEKGLASYNKKDGSRAYATDKIRGVDFFYEVEGNYYLRDQRNSKNIIYGIDMTNGETKGSVQSKGKGGSPKYGSGIDITSDGEFIFAFKGKKVEKIKVNN
ncbi:PQQ-binding-like beta-propeller repeat protein [Flavobacterium sp.]|jgi:hypothetical protein|uniref:outer membrane protein assembly factor BamB family protein n=1 Tax=Flavobacterium sp. TaxID=239 RepID=UPI0037C0CA5B